MMKTLPKVELHCHLDCGLSYDVVSRLRPSISYSDFRKHFVAPRRCTSLADFLTCPPNSIALMQTEPELRAVVLDLFHQLQADNVIYAEIRFAPLLHLEKGLSPVRVVEIVDQAVAEGIAATGIEVRVILCTLRHFTAAQSLETVALADRFRGTRIVALDLAADEAGFPIDPHVEAFEFAINNDIHRTAHAGEARGADSVLETLRNFSPTRIGHGVRSVEDSNLVAHLRQHRIHLEVCPSSNLQTNIYPELSSHPIDALFRAGVPLSISTDARTVTDTDLAREYQLVADTFGWSAHQFLHTNLDAISAAFIPRELQDYLRARLLSHHQSLS